MTQELATTHQQLTSRPDPFALTTFEQVKEMAAILAEATMYGLKQPAQFISLMMRAHEEQITLGRLMERVHVFPDGKFANRADWLQAEFEEKAGRIIWHVRTDDLCVATFILGKEITDEQRARAEQRMELMIERDDATWIDPRDLKRERKLDIAIGKLAREGEETVLRSTADAESKGIAMTKGGQTRKDNWFTSPRSMLQWRCVSEGVKVICPRILSGMPTDIEYNDVRTIQERQSQRLTTATTITDGDVGPILEIIAQHDAELASDIPDARRKVVQGLRMDLVCKLADLGVKAPGKPEGPQPTVGGIPATVVETVVLPPDKAETTQKQPSARQQRPKPHPVAAPADDIDQTPRSEQGMDTPWREFVCLRGPLPGMMNGHTLDSIFVTGRMAPNSPLKLDKLMAWFTGNAYHTSSDPHDKVLWAKAQEADKELRGGFAAGTTATPASTQTAPTAEKPMQQPAIATDWRSFVIPGRHPDFCGKTLGSLGAEGIKRLQDEYLIQIVWEKATLPQKSLKAQVALAMAELFPSAQPDLPDKANSTHPKEMLDTLAMKKWNPDFFLTTCKLNVWVEESRRRVEDIDEHEWEGLKEGWSTVEEEMAKAHQPAQQP